MKLSIIGNGTMARALINGLIDSYEIEVIGRDEFKLKTLHDIFPKIETKLFENFNSKNRNIILCVKPYALESIEPYFKNEANIIISVLAGSKIEKIKKSIKAKNYIRFMPNLGAKVLKSSTTVTGDISQKELALNIADSIGHSIWVDSETELDIATALAGSGPAYLAIVAEALIDGAVKEGLSRDRAKALTASLFDGFGELLRDEHPAVIKDSTMSPAGTTARGCFELENDGVRGSFMRAINSAFERTKEL